MRSIKHPQSAAIHAIYTAGQRASQHTRSVGCPECGAGRGHHEWCAANASPSDGNPETLTPFERAVYGA